MSTTASIFLTVALVLWRVYEDRKAARERTAVKARQDAQEQVIRGMQDALAQCPFVTDLTPYTDNGKRKS